MKTVETYAPDTAGADIDRIFEKQTAHQYSVAQTTASQRRAKLKALQNLVFKYRDEIKEAINLDLKKHPSETDLNEVLPLVKEIKHTRKHLSRWMRKETVDTPLTLLGSSSYIHYEPKGVCLVIAPWNFPFMLLMGPLVSALAAGNTVILKPSEMTPRTSELIAKMIPELFVEEEVAVVQGGVDTSQHLLSLKFNHIFFTGSPKVGKIVMAAAAEHLTSVTLELGGKSPTIVDETVNLDIAARRITWGKYLNNGQVCIAPDHVYVHESVKDQFVEKLKQRIKAEFGEDEQESTSYSRIVNNKHFGRINNLLADAILKGAILEYGGQTDEADNYIKPTILSDVPTDAEIMSEEIFGPILPIISFNSIDDVITQINNSEKPLALYIYSKSRKNIKTLLNGTRAGGTAINHNIIHFFNQNLPFGGVNNSGIGKSNGIYGFKAFSNERSVVHQKLPSAVDLLMPPYTGWKQKLIDVVVKWL